LGFLCAVNATENNGEQERNIQLEAKLSNLLKTQGIQGITWHVIDENGARSGGLGLANVTTHQSMTDSTPVHVGSVMKTLLAIGVLRFIEKSDLSLDSEVTPLLSTPIIDNPWRDSSPVLIRHLLEHTAGLNNLNIWQFLNSQPTEDTPLKAALLARDNAVLKIRSKPGTQYSYSNTGYALLAWVLEEVSGQRYEDYLDRELLSEVGMGQSTFHFTHQKQDAAVPLAMGYLEDNQEIQALPTYLRPAGQFTTTAKDMLAFSMFLLGNGNLRGQQFIRLGLIKQLAEPSTTKAALAGLRIGHGLALALRDRHGVLGQCHPGTTFGFRANFCVFPDQGKAFFYSVNTDSEIADYSQFDVAFIKALNLTDTATVNPMLESGSVHHQNIEGFYLFSPNNMEEFAWLDAVFGVQHMSWKGSKLVISSLQNADKTLVPISGSLFRAIDRRIPSHVVYESDGDSFLSDGLNTFKKASVFTVVYYWGSSILGLMGLFYILVVATSRFVLKSTTVNKYLQWPWYSLLLFTIPIFAFSQQSFIHFGELTLASGLLTIASLLLPISLTISAIKMVKPTQYSQIMRRDLIATVLALHLIIMLLYWGALPIKFWVMN